MKITKYIHSCVLLEESGDSILFDPGIFSFMDSSITPELFKNVKLLVITHNHPDHLDMDSVQKIVTLSNAPVLTTPEIAEAMEVKGFTGTILSDIEYEVGAFTLKAIPAHHEQILAPEIPQNYGYFINGRVLHPGDSYDDSLIGHNADVLLLPISAPWATELDAFEFAKNVAPKIVIPIHDGYVKDFFLKSRYDNYQKNLEPHGIEFKGLANPGDSVEV